MDELRKLSLTECRAPSFRSPWVYRGHGDAGWELQPAAWRKIEDPGLASIREWIRPKFERAADEDETARRIDRSAKIRTEYIDHHVAVLAEVQAVWQFCSLADDLGLTIPDAEKLMTLDESICAIIESQKNPLDELMLDTAVKKELFPDKPFVFAQHHGVPTRYLDWTQDPLVGAFFAAEYAWQSLQTSEQKSKRKSTCLSVWAIKRERDRTGIIKWVTAPRSQHQYLHAQSGVCSVIARRVADGFKSANGSWPDFAQGAFFNDNKAPEPLLKEFKLPAEAAFELLKELSSAGVTRAKLMPTLDNVAIQTKMNWRRLKEDVPR